MMKKDTGKNAQQLEMHAAFFVSHSEINPPYVPFVFSDKATIHLTIYPSLCTLGAYEGIF